MPENASPHTKIIIGFLVLLATLLWIAVITFPDPKLHLITCDVGQGDAHLIIQSQTQLLIDGGPNSKVLDCLSDNMPFWDNTIEAVIISHPQSDHFAGIIDVAGSYNIQTILASGLDASSQDWSALKDTLGGEGTTIYHTSQGDKFRLGLIYLDILWPSQDLISQNSSTLASNQNNQQKVLGAFTSTIDPNDFSVVLNLSYKEFNALYTGDIGPSIIDSVLQTNKVNTVDLLKVPHHGSKNGLTKELLDATTPEIAIIPVGKNPWGHPHQQILDLLDTTANNPAILRTDKQGTIEIITDGTNWKIK